MKKILRFLVREIVYGINQKQMITTSPCGQPSYLLLTYIGSNLHSRSFYEKLKIEGDDLSEVKEAKFKLANMQREQIMRKKFSFLY